MATIELIVDSAGLHRLAGHMLRQTQPKDADAALNHLQAGLSAYVTDKGQLNRAVSEFFKGSTQQ